MRRMMKVREWRARRARRFRGPMATVCIERMRTRALASMNMLAVQAMQQNPRLAPHIALITALAQWGLSVNASRR